jgi:hypothetical protein
MSVVPPRSLDVGRRSLAEASFAVVTLYRRATLASVSPR